MEERKVPEWLKPVVPQYVAEWFEDNNGQVYLGDLYGDLFMEDGVPDEVDAYFERFECTSQMYILLANMAQFGYTIEPENQYRIKAPKIWNMKTEGCQCIYLRRWNNKCGFDLTFASYATTFTKQEAEELMKRLKVDWELEEVLG